MDAGSYFCAFLGFQESDDICKNLFWSMGSVFIYTLLPLAGLTMIWSRYGSFANFLMTIEQYYLTVAFYSFGRRNMLLNWAKRRLPSNWSSSLDTLSGGIADFWSDGSLLCTLINTAVPGACPNPYRHWQKTPVHAQDVAYKYLGITPNFTESDFASSLNPYLESKLLNYLILIQKSIMKIEKEKQMYNLISTRYVARGMGLYTAEQYKESEIFIYSKIQNPSFYNVEISIVGPYGTQCRTTVLENLAKECKKSSREIKINNGWLKAKENYMEKLKSMNNSQISESSIEIKIEMEYDRVRVLYSSKNYGVHKISLSCNKEFIMGSPFYINILKSSNSSSINKEINANFSISDNTEEDYTVKKINTEKYKSISEVNKTPLDTFGKEIKQNNGEVKHNVEEIQNNINEIKNTMKNMDRVDDNTNIKVDVPRITDDNLIGSLEISRFIKDLNSLPKKLEIDNCTSSEPPNDKEACSGPVYFTKENYSCFQRAVDNSFRRSCRITRKSPRLVQSSYPVVFSASPLCNNHIAPEDFGKLSVEEKRKIFSQQNSLPLESEKQRTSSPVSINENLKEPSSNKKQNINDEESNQRENLSSCKQLNVNNFESLHNIDDIKTNDEDSKLCKIVKEKKRFWETVIQNTNAHKSDDRARNSNNHNLPTTEKKHNKSSLNTKPKLTKTNADDLIANPKTLKHVDSVCLLRNRSFSRSYNDLRCLQRKRSLVTYKSMDDNLDQCSNISLDYRTRIYLDHVSSFDSKMKEDFGPAVKLRKNNQSEGVEWNPTDDRNIRRTTYFKINENNIDPTSEKRENQLKSLHYRKTIKYFKSLQPINYTLVNRINSLDDVKRQNTVPLRNSYSECNNFKYNNYDNNICTKNTYSTCNIKKNYVITTFLRNRDFDSPFDKEQIDVNINPKYFRYNNINSIKNVSDVLY